MIDHVVRRGLQHASGTAFFKRAVEGGNEVEMPKWGIALLASFFLAFIVFLSAVEYTLKDVVATLTMVETPAAAITVSASEESAPKDVKEGLLETAPTMTLVRTKPITSSIRATIRHLVSEGGRLARWRGFWSHALWAIALNITANVISGLLPMRLPLRMILISGVAGAICANLHAAWTHKVISTPSDTKFWQRVPARSSWKVLALPAAISAAMPYLTIYIMRGLFMLLGFNGRASNDEFARYSGAQWALLVFRILSVIVISIALFLFLCLPAIVTLIRVEASILPEDQDTIVPFDRTFDGKVVPKILGGTGSISFLDAWRSFNWEARRRILKLYVKIFAIMTGLSFIFVHVFLLLAFVIMGSSFQKILSQARQNGNGSVVIN